MDKWLEDNACLANQENPQESRYFTPEIQYYLKYVIGLTQMFNKYVAQYK